VRHVESLNGGWRIAHNQALVCGSDGGVVRAVGKPVLQERRLERAEVFDGVCLGMFGVRGK